MQNKAFKEYKELFLSEALENFEELNRLFIDLEKEHSNKNAINSIFRITHTLKGNAMGMGFEALTELSHVMEDMVGAIKNGEIRLDQSIFESLFRANDKLGALIKAIETEEKVSYLGIKTKLAIILKNARSEKNAGKESDQDTTSNDGFGENTGQKEDLKQKETTEGGNQPQITFADVIQIPVKKMDELMNLVGQLIIERDRLISLSSGRGSEFEGLLRISSNLHYSVMNARMVQMSFLFNKFHRIVRDVASIEGKNIDLSLKGTEVEIDRNILKTMSDSLIHLVRNAVSHGIESGEERKLAGKPETGSIVLSAHYEKDSVVIMVSDDGKGIDAHSIKEKIVEKRLVSFDVAQNMNDEEAIAYIFEPGFSNAEKVTEISGRGVGMDVVKKAVESIGGQVTLDTGIGKGTTINLLVPSSLALKGALLFQLNKQEYAVALSYTEAVISLTKDQIHKISGGLMSKYVDSTISVVFLNDLIEMEDLTESHNNGALHHTFDDTGPDTPLDVIVVSYTGKMTGIVIDKLLQQKEIIEKPLSKPLDKNKLLSGTTILGNGSVCPVIDIVAITDILYKNVNPAS